MQQRLKTNEQALLAKLLAQHTNEISKSKKILAEKESDRDALLRLVEHKEAEQRQSMTTVQQFAAAFEQKIKNFSTEAHNKLNSIHDRLDKLKKQASSAPVAETLSKVRTDTKAEADKPRTTLALMQSIAPAPSAPVSSNGKTEDFKHSFVVVNDNGNGHSQLPTQPDAFDIQEHAQMDPVYVRQQLDNGKKYAEDIIAGDLSAIPTGTQEEYLRSIIAIQWYLYGKAVEKGQGFEEGTFVIKDKDFKIYNFMMGYVKKMNPAITGDVRDPLAMKSYNQFGYSRDASHFIHLKKQFRPYGIDIRFGENGSETPLLPAYKRHILFGRADETDHKIYIKPENYGLYYKDGFLMHAQEYGAAQVRKPNVFAQAARTIAGYLGYEISTDQALGFRKERIPPLFVAEFNQNLDQEDSIDLEQKKLLKNYVKINGYQTLFLPSIVKAPKFQDLIDKCRKDKRLDHLEDRIGEEVIFKHNELTAKRIER